MRDIFHFTSLIASDKSASTNVRIAANALLDEYNNTILRFISGSKQKDAMGPTVYFPDSSINNQYRSRLKFSNEHWDEFLELFLTPIQITHIPLNDSESGTGEFEITATIKGFSLDEENIFLFYTDTTSSNRITIQLEPTGNDHEYSAKFGLSNFGSEVHYCISTTENSLGTHIYSPQNVN